MQGSLPTGDFFFEGDLVETNKVIVYLKDIETGDNILEFPGRTTALFLGYLKPKRIAWHQQMYEKSIVLVNGVRGWVWSSDISHVG
jgi:hypothetical protein